MEKKEHIVHTRLNESDFKSLIEETQIQGKQKASILRQALKLYFKIVAFLEADHEMAE